MWLVEPGGLVGEVGEDVGAEIAVPPRSPNGPFLYADHAALAKAANALQHLFKVHGSRPGERLTVPIGPGTITSSRSEWVHPNQSAEARALADQHAFRRPPASGAHPDH
ncbi:hypothetical protein [Streptomyces chattanoogensis]|uniref:hypothetical protein n=1 Tax=Streptomyces chattanoogensis TaxID=66876 RepID=UPI0036A72DB1